MALSPITYVSGSYNTAPSGSSVTTNSFSATAGDLLIADIASGGASSQAVSSLSESGITISGSWTIYQVATAGSAFLRRAIAVAQYSSGTGTVTATFAGTQSLSSIGICVCPAGYDTTTPVAQSQTGTGTTSTTPSITFSGTPASGSRLFAGIAKYVGDPSDTVTPGSGWNELRESQGSNSQNQVQEAAGSNGTTINWTLSDAAGSPSNLAMVAIEIQEAAGGGGSSPSPIFETIFRAVNS